MIEALCDNCFSFSLWRESETVLSLS